MYFPGVSTFLISLLNTRDMEQRKADEEEDCIDYIDFIKQLALNLSFLNC